MSSRRRLVRAGRTSETRRRRRGERDPCGALGPCPPSCCSPTMARTRTDAPHGRRRTRSTPPAMTAARWAYAHDEPAGADTATLPMVPWLFRAAARRRQGTRRASASARTKARRSIPKRRALLDTLADQAAAALDRASLTREMVSATDRDRDRARAKHIAGRRSRTTSARRCPRSSARPPACIDYGDKLDDAAQAATCSARSSSEAEGLDEMVRNLLAITRIDAGALEIRRDWIDLARDRRARGQARRGGVARRRHSTSSCRMICRWCGPTPRSPSKPSRNVVAQRGGAHAGRHARCHHAPDVTQSARRPPHHRRRTGHRAPTLCRMSSRNS